MLNEWMTLLRLFRRRIRSSEDYYQFQAYQGVLVLQYLLEHGIHLQNSSVLDVGCGNGGYSDVLAGAGAHVLSIDLRRRFRAGLSRFVLADALQIPFASDSFQMVFCTSLIEHVPDPLQLLLEIKRVLTADGFIYLSFPPFYSPVGGHQFKPYHLLGERWALRLSRYRANSYAAAYGSWGLYPLSIRRARQLLATAGLVVCQVCSCGRNLPT